ncbi:hypothetical protein O0L34_g18109 [Tuta absoluta]|nr:hypothetical protein O0L34_g18109 [Tuta absoluta]
MKNWSISDMTLQKSRPSNQKVEDCSISNQEVEILPHSDQKIENRILGDQNSENSRQFLRDKTRLSGQKLGLKNSIHSELKKSSTVLFVGDLTKPPSNKNVVSAYSSRTKATVSIDPTKCDAKSETLDGEGSFAECPKCKLLVIEDITRTQFNRGFVEVMPCCPNWQISIGVLCLLCIFMVMIRKWIAKL